MFPVRAATPSAQLTPCRLYNHIRTVAFWLDASPLLADLGLPFRAGIDDIISLVPLYGDIASGILQLYQVWLSFVFGVPLQIIGWMVRLLRIATNQHSWQILNVLLDTVAGIVPIIGDIIDNLFKSNLRNLALLENWLLNDQYTAAKYHILLMPESDEFVPGPSARWKGWFGGKVDREEMAARDRERATGKVRKTRRMGREEGAWEVPVSGGPTQDGLD